ncbi:MAG TPA: SpoIID/LytB domain-containing protein, partial [Trichocoleus sp.]
MVKPLQELKPPQAKPARLHLIKLPQISVDALRASFQRLSTGDPKTVVSPSYLAVASGLVFTSVLAAQFVPLPLGPLQRLKQPSAFQDTLWQATGVVRQSIVGLYRAQRVLLPLPVAGTAAAAQPPSATQPSGAAQPKPGQAPGQAAPTARAAAPAAAPAQANLKAPTPQRAVVNPGSTIDSNLEMRVAIARNVSTLEVGVSSDGFLMDLNGQNYCNLPAQTSYTARATGQGMDFGNCQLGTAAWLEAAEGGYVYIGGSWFKGRVLLLNDGGNLLAVNFVLLQDYLSSVVGSEMYVNWPIEALKA